MRAGLAGETAWSPQSYLRHWGHVIGDEAGAFVCVRWRDTLGRVESQSLWRRASPCGGEPVPAGESQSLWGESQSLWGESQSLRTTRGA